MSQGRLAAKKPLYRHLNNLLTITLQGYVAVYTVPHLDPVQVNDKQKRSRVARGCEITNKRVLFPGQGTFTHSAHTVAPHSLSAPPLTNRICPDLGPA